MTEEDFIATYPRLWHMAHDGAWPSIQQQGLLSAEALADAYGLQGARRTAALSQRRPQSMPLTAPGLPAAVIRDQKPMSDLALTKCLINGLTPSDWYAILNRYSFFWLSRDRVRTLINARAYRNSPQTVLTVDTASLINAHRQAIRLSPMNSGATFHVPLVRDAGIFHTIANFPFAERRPRPPRNNVVELVVDYSVPDVVDHVLAVHRVKQGHDDELLWRADRAEESDHP